MTATTKRDAANLAFVGDLQTALGITSDGWAGEATRQATERAIGMDLRPPVVHVPGLSDFRGDLERVHRWEGHNGRPYWPGGASGVTLDPGFDLGYQTAGTLRELYDFLGAAALDVLAGVIGVRGAAAKPIVARPAFRAIRISEDQAVRVMPVIAVNYWRAIVRRFPVLAERTTPGAIHTSMLSLAYNRGAGNTALGVLLSPLAARDWSKVADLIAEMQQDHRLAGIRRRRKEEADVIRSGLEARRT